MPVNQAFLPREVTKNHATCLDTSAWRSYLKKCGIGPVVDAILASIIFPNHINLDSGLGFRFCWSDQPNPASN